MRKLRKFVVVNKFKELPKESDFEIVEENIRNLKPKEFLIKTEYISVDPYMLSFARGMKVPYEQFGFQIGKVIESINPEYPIGAYVVSHSGWRDYCILNGDEDEMFRMRPYKPDIGNLSPSLAIGAVGMPGIAAYLGFMEICMPKKGDTVCVTSAAGAVGSVVGQIAKVIGCVVIGIAGSDAKVNMLKDELGFHHVINYKTEDVDIRLKAAAPNGIDCYFDNVGGALSDIIISKMKTHSRVAICGSISTYGQIATRQKRPHPPVAVHIECFSFTQWDWSKQSDALKQLTEWLGKGTIKAKETVTNGFEELPNTFVAMLKGDCVGKAVVKV